MRKVLEDQTGFTRKKAEDARRRRMDSQVRRTRRRAVRQRKRYLQSDTYRAVQMVKAIDWKKIEGFMDHFGMKIMNWQRRFLEQISLINDRQNAQAEKFHNG